MAGFRISRVLCWCGAVVLLAGCAAHRQPALLWQAGLAETDITPPIGFRLAGYFDERLSTGVHDPLQAKAIVLQEGGQRVALVFCDLIGLSLNVTRPAREEASRRTGIPVGQIIVAATHSHTGPLFDDVRRDVFHQEALAKSGRDPQEVIDYPSFLRQRIVDAIVAANDKLQPAQLQAGIAQQEGMPFNRRYYMKNGKVAFNPGHLNPNIVKPAGPVDHDLGILLIKSAADGQPLGGLTVFAMHCDTVSGTEISADYPYYIQQSLRHILGSRYISAFGLGTAGDLNHIDVTRAVKMDEGFDVARSIGDRLAATELSAQPQLTPITGSFLAVKDKTLMLPLQKTTPAELQQAKHVLAQIRDPKVDFYAKVRAVKAVDLAQRGAVYPFEIQVVRLDLNTAIVCLPAEIFVQFGLEIKQASPFRHTFVITVCNDRPFYVPTRKAFREGSYEVTNSRVAPGDGEVMADTAIQMLREMRRN